MVLSSQISPGMTLSISQKLYKVETCVKVTVPKGAPFIKTKLRDLANNKIIEKNFKVDQDVSEVSLAERSLEFLYIEGKDYLFIDIHNLDQVLVPAEIISDKADYLKEGVDVKGAIYGNKVFAIELPQFLELMVAKIEEPKGTQNSTKVAILETGAKVDVPLFIQEGDIIKVETKTNAYVQRV